ncbi:protein FAM181B [Heterocephalus glaber]|uniref:Protein FAM181B n=1 Tax=Heterocephalus glaber TaxID=10181 RepID=A0AAX6Q916_HETGA|nr:protein FAM181B [Heterocephalus glaber]
MAVQAALLSTHPFVPFGFGGSPDGLGGAFGALDKGCCFEDDENGAPAGALLPGAEGGDVREATRDLLSFIDSASSNIKLALDKPGKSKRKVNHRKYLQKQIKRCSGLMGGGPPSPGAADGPAKRPPALPCAPAVPTPAHGKAVPRREASQAAAAASLQSRSLAALFDSLRYVPGGAEPAGGAEAVRAQGHGGASAGGAGGDAAGPAVSGSRKVPLRARNLPPSFFTEPSRAGGGGGGPSGPGVSLGDLEKGAEAVEFFELLGPDYGAESEAGVLLAAEPLDAFPTGAAVLRGPLELEPGLFEPPPPVIVGNLLYPEPWSAQSCPPAKKPPLEAAPAGLTLNEALRPLYPAAADSPGVEDGPGPVAPFAPFFPDCALPQPHHQVSYDYSTGYSRTPYSSLWRPDGVWDGAPGEEGLPRD